MKIKKFIFILIMFSLGCFSEKPDNEIEEMYGKNEDIEIEAEYRGEKIPFVNADVFYFNIEKINEEVEYLKLKGNCIIVENMTFQENERYNKLEDVVFSDDKNKLDIKLYVFAGNNRVQMETKITAEMYSKDNIKISQIEIKLSRDKEK